METPGLPEGFVPVTEDICRMCGWTDGGLTWEDGWPTASICACCGTESGIGDMGWPGNARHLEGIRAFRGWWVGNGAVWYRPYHRPPDWDLLTQLANIPQHWR
ncbi:hypothetical protein [Streptomyces sp. NPDC058953]|uniref:hypothetical protein n=1 Tax=unclassified Streptomyces TaxID=2593676 RepID=UPI0036B02A48